MTKSIEEIMNGLDELESRGILFNCTDTVSRVEAKSFLRSSLTSLRNATIEECVEALPNEVIVEEVDEGAGFVPNTSDEAIADRSRNWIISEARQSLTALKSKEEKI